VHSFLELSCINGYSLQIGFASRLRFSLQIRIAPLLSGILSLDLVSRQQITQPLVLTLDGAYEYTDADLDYWDAEGPGSTFKKYYREYYDLALSFGLDPALKPTKLDISDTVRWLGYKPSYSLASLLSELAVYGDSGPPHLIKA